MKNLYTVEYELVTSQIPKHETIEEQLSLPTHVLAVSESNALETALAYQTRNFQLKRCYLAAKNVNIANERL